MPTIFCTVTAAFAGSSGGGSTIPTPMSSAIASGLARGYSLEQAVERAKEYLSGALEAMLDLGSGSGPMDHGFQIP